MSLTLHELVQATASGLNQAASKPNILNYDPHEKQIEFHQDETVGRLFAGGNRSGKTVAGICEDIWWLTGKHPYIETPEPPVYGRLITVDFKNGSKKIIEPTLRQWVPRSELIGNSWDRSWNKSDHILTLRNGSKLEIMSHDQDLEAFAGSARHFLHVDEECPRTIFTESKLRLVDFNGRYWLTMTPVEGMTWVYEDLVENSNERIKIFTASVHDNPAITGEGKDSILSDISEEERAIREHGTFVPKGGLVLKEFQYDDHVIVAGKPPPHWTIYVSIDAGFNNPTAVLWHAVRPEDGTLITFAEHYKAEWTVAMHAQAIKEMNEQLGVRPEMYVGDPAMGQRQQSTGLSIIVEYRQHDIPVAPGKKDVHAGLNKMNDYFRLNKWFITKDCPNLIREIRQYRWKTYASSKNADLNNKREEPQKKNDHAIDSSRYLFTFMPKLDKRKAASRGVDKAEIARVMQPGTTFNPKRAKVFPWQMDPNLVHRGPPMPQMGWGEEP
jgi:hypothetical protein